MGTLTVRNVPDEVIERVRTSAELNRRSMEQEVRLLLEARFAPKAEVLDRARARWKKTKGPTKEQVEAWRSQGRR